MNRLIVIHVSLVIFLLRVVSPGISRAAVLKPLLRHARTAVSQTDTQWLQLAPEREEFSVMIPAPPRVLTQPGNYSYEEGGERVLEHQYYDGYADGFVFVIESIRAAHPQRILKPIVQTVSARATFERDVTVDGYKGKEYKSNSTSFYGRILCLLANEHVYVLTLAARDEKSMFPERFLNSFKLSDQGVARIPAASQPSSDASVAESEIFKSKDVTRKAVIAWKPEPAYTEQARQHEVTGTIVLKAILAANGEVTDVKVSYGLRDGLTKNAVEAARNIRFFPAEKEGRLVSLQVQLEYNFNLY